MMDGFHGTSADRSMHCIFMLDSGASVHCTGDRSLLSDYHDEVPDFSLRGASGEEMQVRGIGSIHNENFQVKGVLYIPGLNYGRNVSKTIFSVVKLNEVCLSVRFNSDGTSSVIDNSKWTWNSKHKIVGEARISYGLYMLDYLRIPPNRDLQTPNRDWLGLLKTLWLWNDSVSIWSSITGRLLKRTTCAQRPPDVSAQDAVVAVRLDAAIKGKQAVLGAEVVQPEIAEVSAQSYWSATELFETGESSKQVVAALVKERTANGVKGKVPNRQLKRIITSWIKGQHLGSGSFGSVYEAISGDGFFFAVKEVSLVDERLDAKERILQLEHEISLLSRLEHENIVQYFGTEKEAGKLYIFLELVTQGSLEALYQKYCLQDSQVSAYTRQILNGLHYLHQQNVLHRDIKCANILIDVNGVVKLADFGLAKEISNLSQAKSSKGTIYWMAPEVARAKPHGPPADVWSLGCTVLEMLTREVPYPDMEWTNALLNKIGKGIPPKIPDTLSKDARDFIKKCVQANPNVRPSAAQLLKHPFVQRPLQQYGGTTRVSSLRRRSPPATAFSPAFPKDAKFLNRPISNYMAMQTIFGNGVATGKFVMESNEALGQPYKGDDEVCCTPPLGFADRMVLGTPTPPENTASAARRFKTFADKVVKPRPKAILPRPSPKKTTTPWRMPLRSRRIAAQSHSRLPASKRGEYLILKRLGHISPMSESTAANKFDALFGGKPEDDVALGELFPEGCDVGARKRRRRAPRVRA